MMNSCVDASTSPDLLAVYEVSPVHPLPGGGMSIMGRGFGIQGTEDQVILSGDRLEVLYWSAERIDCRIPNDLIPGAKWMVVSAGGRVSRSVEVEVLDPRAIDLNDMTHDVSMMNARLRDQNVHDMLRNPEMNTDPLTDFSLIPDQGGTP